MENGSDNFHLDTADNLPLPGTQEGVPVPSAILQPHILLENIEDGICLLEAAENVRVIYASLGFYNMLGLSPSDFRLPCDLKDIGIHTDYEADYEQALRSRISCSGAAEHIHRIRDSKGNWLWRHVRFSRISCPGSKYPVLMEISRDVTASIQTRQQLKESAERLQVAFRQSRSLLWEVELSTADFLVYSLSSRLDRPDTVIPHFPDSLLSDGIIHPDSADAFRRFAEGLLAGKDADTGNFIMKDREDGGYNWFSLSYRQVSDGDHRPVKAVGIQERLPSVSGIYSFGMPRRPLPESLRHNLLARLHINLTADTVEELWRDGSDQTARTSGLPYSQVLDTGKDFLLFHQADSQVLKEFFSRRRLLDAYEQGETWAFLSCERVDNGGNVGWVAGVVNLVQNTLTKDIHLFACFNDAEKRHEWELLAENGAQSDPLSGLYSGQTVREIAVRFIRSEKDARYALALIRMNGNVFDSAAPDRENLRKRRFIMTALSFALGLDCIVGRQDDSSLVVFFPDISSRFEIKKRIEDAYAYVRNVMEDLNGLDRIRFVSCVIVNEGDCADYDLLLSRSASLCSVYTGAAMDMVVFPDRDEDWTWTRLCGEDGDCMVLPGTDGRPLTREEEQLVFDCLSSMLSARSATASVEGVLRRLGRHYRASKLYILALSEKRQNLSVLYEWDSRQKYSIRHIISGMPLERFPLLERCRKQKETIVTKSNGESFGTHERGEFWYFTVIPLMKQDEVAGFLCMENARKNAEDPTLLQVMIPYMKTEQERYREFSVRPELTVSDALNRLPNLRAYLDMADQLTSDTSSSMGALTLDVPNFSAINANQGYDHGREMLGFIAETLADVYGKAYIFRTWDAEFTVLYPNTIMEVFMSRCTRLRTMLQRRYPGQIRIGYTWADGVYTARNLVKEARSIMQCENVRRDTGERLLFLAEPHFDAGKAASENFIAYFQPKIDIRDGSLAGAEALVRGIDQAGHIIPPGQFIETMEQDGTIRELDLLMLEKVLSQLSDWKRRGLPDIQVSVNISRFTLFNPTTLASILAIQSHFPEVSPEQIELEITETAGDVEKATLSSLVDSFRQFGLRFELDDFGSHYANVSIFSNIRFNAIKLDRTLINDLPGNEISRMLVENIVNICHSFDMRCVAEGVETRQQEAALLAAGCTLAQGFYYARPLPPRSFEEQYLKKEVI